MHFFPPIEINSHQSRPIDLMYYLVSRKSLYNHNINLGAVDTLMMSEVRDPIYLTWNISVFSLIILEFTIRVHITIYIWNMTNTKFTNHE